MLTKKKKQPSSRLGNLWIFMLVAAAALSGLVSSAYAVAPPPPSPPSSYANSEDITVTDSPEAYGINEPSRTVDNSGNLDVTAADSGMDLKAYGIYSGYAVTSTGIISATTTADTGDGRAYGIYTESGGVANNGALTITSTADEGLSQAWGIRANSGAVTNSGAITATATATSTVAGDYGQALGIYAISGAVDNSGDIIVTASATADGISRTYGIYAVSGAVTNSGDITATTESTGGDSRAYGIANDSAGGVTNSGTITVTAEADGGHGWAFGLYSGGAITNDGEITATTVADEFPSQAVGIYATSGTVTNNAEITTDATATGTAVSRAYGIWNASSEGVTNSADISSTAQSTEGDSYALGIYAASGGVANSNGNITVSATSETGTAYAFGFYIAGDAELTSTGIIQALADTWAYEVYVESGTTTLVDTYNLNLDRDPDTGSLYVASGATLDLNDAALTLTSVGSDFQWNTAYQLFAGDGTVSGEFSTVSALNPNVTVIYDDQTDAGSGDDTVALAYTPVGSPFLEGADLLRHAVSLTGSLVEQRLLGDFLQPFLAAAEPHQPRLYAAAGNVATDTVATSSATRNFFLTPYYTNIRKDASPVGYDSDAVGFVTGYEARNNDTLYGFHLGYSHNELDFTGTGFSSNEEDQDILTAGLHAMGSLGHWTWRGRLTGFYAWHNYDGLTGAGLNLAESADYDSLGANATLMGGYLIQLGRHLLLPEAGLDYFWLHQEGFTTDVDNAGWEEHNDSLDEHQVAAVASLRWLTRLQAGGDLVVTPSAAVGVRCLLTDDEIDVHQSVPGIAPVTVSSEQDDVAATASASLVFANQSRWSSELAYAGEYGDDTTAHSAWLRFNYRF
jgi:hypothetical protein